MQETVTLPALDFSSDTVNGNMSSTMMVGNTPKRSSGVVQPIPRRLLPPSAGQSCFPPTSKTTADDNSLYDVSNTRYVETPNTSSDGGSDSPPESTLTSIFVPGVPPSHPTPALSALLDLSTRKRSAFSVTDLLEKKEVPKLEPRHPAYNQQVYPSLAVPYPTYPPAYMFPPRMDMYKHADYSTVPVKEDTSPKEVKAPCPIGPSRSLTSSPESPKSDTSVSDRSDANNSMDPDTSPGLFKAALDRKNNRTNYTPMQVRRLEKVFLENPYPEHEMYEHLSKELSIPEPRLKVWFQNKRARWKRRAEDKMTQPSAFPFPMLPMGYPYGMMPGPMTSPPESPTALPMYSYAPAPNGLMMYQRSGYPSPVYPYMPHSMYVQQ